jgi:hypothetical protein
MKDHRRSTSPKENTPKRDRDRSSRDERETIFQTKSEPQANVNTPNNHNNSNTPNNTNATTTTAAKLRHHFDRQLSDINVLDIEVRPETISKGLMQAIGMFLFTFHFVLKS